MDNRNEKEVFVFDLVVFMSSQIDFGLPRKFWSVNLPDGWDCFLSICQIVQVPYAKLKQPEYTIYWLRYPLFEDISQILNEVGVPIYVEDASSGDDRLFHEWKLNIQAQQWLGADAPGKSMKLLMKLL